jgi:hypothetical protein
VNSTPLTADQLAAIRQRAFSTKCAPNHPGALFTFMDGAKDAADLLAEVDRQRAQLEDARKLIRDFDQARQSAVKERDDAKERIADVEWAGTLTHQACQHGKHADWWADTEHNHRCPWCEIVRLSALLTGDQP